MDSPRIIARLGLALLTISVAALLASVATSRAEEPAPLTCNQWDAELVQSGVEALPLESPLDPQAYRTALWEEMALCGYEWDFQGDSLVDLLYLEWPKTLTEIMSSRAEALYRQMTGRGAAYPRDGLNYGACIEVRLGNGRFVYPPPRAWLSPGVIPTDECLWGSQAYLIGVNRNLWTLGGFPHSDLLHELVHLQLHISNGHLSTQPLHDGAFRSALMKAHINFNPWFDAGHVVAACELADQIEVEVPECSAGPPYLFRTVKYGGGPVPEDQIERLPYIEWQPDPNDPATGKITVTTDPETGLRTWTFVQPSGTTRTVAEPAPTTWEPSKVEIDPKTGETITTYTVGTITCVIRSSGSSNCTDSSKGTP